MFQVTTLDLIKLLEMVNMIIVKTSLEKALISLFRPIRSGNLCWPSKVYTLAQPLGRKIKYSSSYIEFWMIEPESVYQFKESMELRLIY